MKKLLLTAAIGIGLFAVSCGTKESSMSTSNRDSAMDSSRKASPAATDTMTSKKMNPDSIKMKKDSTVMSPVK
jgi:hypothetical protein